MYLSIFRLYVIRILNLLSGLSTCPSKNHLQYYSSRAVFKTFASIVVLFDFPIVALNNNLSHIEQLFDWIKLTLKIFIVRVESLSFFLSIIILFILKFVWLLYYNMSLTLCMLYCPKFRQYFYLKVKVIICCMLLFKSTRKNCAIFAALAIIFSQRITEQWTLRGK